MRGIKGPMFYDAKEVCRDLVTFTPFQVVKELHARGKNYQPAIVYKFFDRTPLFAVPDLESMKKHKNSPKNVMYYFYDLPDDMDTTTRRILSLPVTFQGKPFTSAQVYERFIDIYTARQAPSRAHISTVLGRHFRMIQTQVIKSRSNGSTYSIAMYDPGLVEA